MRVRLLHHPVRAVRRAGRMQGRAAPREALNREIEGAPEKVRGTRLALEPRAEHLEHAIGLRERAPDAIDGLGIVARVLAVAFERNRIGEFHRPGVDRDRNIQLRKGGHHIPRSDKQKYALPSLTRIAYAVL